MTRIALAMLSVLLLVGCAAEGLPIEADPIESDPCVVCPACEAMCTADCLSVVSTIVPPPDCGYCLRTLCRP